MSGIYIHIPFCKQACHYCDFHFSTTLKSKDEMIAAIQKEIFLQKDYFTSEANGKAEDKIIRSIYFGGGTPSLHKEDELSRLIDEIKKYFIVDEAVEITLEANPDDLDKQTLKAFHRAGINRLSIGIQSFYNEDLIWMNRSHNAKQALVCVKDAQDAGYLNLSVDLIYGTPVLTNEHWEKNLQTAFNLNIPHLSCYALTVEPRTALAHFIADKQVKNIDESRQAEHLEILMDQAEASGFEHYEISNFAKDRKYSFHNSGYWKGEKYIGIGPSAHSFNGTARQWNVKNNQAYIKAVSEGKIPFEKEVLTEANRFNEYVMISLRTMWGSNLETMTVNFGASRTKQFFKEASKYISQGLIEQKGQTLVLTRQGKFFADRIAAELFQPDESNQQLMG